MQRAGLLGLVAVAGSVGPWALVAPRWFFSSFPGGGRSWVALDGPYNQHLVRDVGALYCALMALTVVALVRPERLLVRVTGLVWLVFGLPHLAYHLAHLDLLMGADRLLNALALGGVVIVAAALCLPERRERAGSESSADARGGAAAVAIARAGRRR